MSYEIIEKLKRDIEGYKEKPEWAEVGRVIEVGDGIVKILGLRNAVSQEVLIIETEHGNRTALALNLEEESIGGLVLDDYLAVAVGDTVRRTGDVLSIAVGDELIGRVIDPLGNPQISSSMPTKKPIGLLKLKKNGGPVAQSHRGDGENIHHRDGDERKRERKVDVARRRPKERHRIRAVPNEHRSDARHKPKPVRGKDKNKDREDEREIALRLPAIAEHRGHEIESPLERDLDDALRHARHHRKPLPEDDRAHSKKHQHNERHQNGVGDRETADMKNILSPERDIQHGSRE